MNSRWAEEQTYSYMSYLHGKLVLKKQWEIKQELKQTNEVKRYTVTPKLTIFY